MRRKSPSGDPCLIDRLYTLIYFDRVNCNVDLIVRGTSLLKKLKLKSTAGVDHDVIHSISELQEAFAYSFSRGAAIERAFSANEIYATVIDVASGLESAHVNVY